MTSTMIERPPTARQLDVLRWVAKYIADKGYSPTNRDVCRAFGFKSPNAAQVHLNPLRKRGLITWHEFRSRTIRLTPAGLELVGGDA